MEKRLGSQKIVNNLRYSFRYCMFLLFILSLPLFTSGCSLGYLLQMGKGQLKIVWRSRPIEEMLDDNHVSALQKEKIRLVLEAKAFGENVIGLTSSKNYTVYCEVVDSAIAYNLVASPRFAVEPYRWCFPIAGCLPYKGFFEKKYALAEQRKFLDNGYDTHLRSVSAYSTLGWFTDPIFSTMLGYPDISLVDVILHEMVHRTIFLKGQGAFNEGIATFIGRKGAKEFFRTVKKKDADFFKELEEKEQEKKCFQEMMQSLAERLRLLYASDLDEAKMLSKKAEIFHEAKQSFEVQSSNFHKARYYKRVLNKEWNNAFVVAYLTYHKDSSLWETVYSRFDNDLGAMVTWLKTFKGDKDPFGSIDLWLEQREPASKINKDPVAKHRE